MSKVNFISEFNSFMRFARNNGLSMRERMFWIALFYVANDRAAYNGQSQEYEWPDDFIQVSNGEMNLYCCLDKRAIETTRNALKQRGLIDFKPGHRNNRNPAYRLNYLSTEDVEYKNAPNDVSNRVPNDVSNRVPNNVPNDVPNNVPYNVPNTPFLGTILPPTMPPYYKLNIINENQGEGKGKSGEDQTIFSGMGGGFPPWEARGLIGLVKETPIAAGGGFVPLEGEEAGL